MAEYLRVLGEHPYAVVFISSLIEAMGIPIPARIILILTPAFLPSEKALVGLIAAATAGALMGDHVPYVAGRVAGTRMLALYCRLTLGSLDCMMNAVRYFARFGSWTILASRFSVSLRLFAAACAGCSGVRYPRYLVLDAIGTVVYVTLWVLVGHAIGERAVAFLTEDRRRYVFVVIVLVAFASVIGYRLWRRRVAGVPRISSLPVTAGSGPRR